MTVQDAQKRITSSEFVEWIVYLDDDASQIKTEYYYLAQIAARISGLFSKNPKEFKTENFILKFVKKLKEKKMTREEATMISKNKWLSGVGYKGKQ